MQRIIIVLLSIFLLTSCMSSKKTEKRPDWTKKATAEFVEKNILVAVGVSEDFGSEGRSWNMAELDARKKMARVVETFISSFQIKEDHAINGNVYNNMYSMVEQTSSATLKDIQVKGKWKDNKKKIYYVQLEVNFSTITKEIEKKVEEIVKPEDKEQAIEDLQKRSEDAKAKLQEKLKNMDWN